MHDTYILEAIPKKKKLYSIRYDGDNEIFSALASKFPFIEIKMNYNNMQVGYTINNRTVRISDYVVVDESAKNIFVYSSEEYNKLYEPISIESLFYYYNYNYGPGEGFEIPMFSKRDGFIQRFYQQTGDGNFLEPSLNNKDDIIFLNEKDKYETLHLGEYLSYNYTTKRGTIIKPYWKN